MFKEKRSLQVIDVEDLKFTACQLIYTFVVLLFKEKLLIHTFSVLSLQLKKLR